jgi:hypothetical protein
MNIYLPFLCGIIILILIIVIIWVAYNVSAAHQQTITYSVSFDETYRYVPELGSDKKYKLDTIKVTINERIKRNTSQVPGLIHGKIIKDILDKHIIIPYTNSLFIQESEMFNIEESTLKRHSTIKPPTMENLSINSFNKLAPIMRDKGCRLVSVSISGSGIKATHSSYRMSNYTV